MLRANLIFMCKTIRKKEYHCHICNFYTFILNLSENKFHDESIGKRIWFNFIDIFLK